MQDSARVDVNVLLFLLWLAAQGRSVNLEEIEEIVAIADPWRREVVGPLRQARRASKKAFPGFHANAVSELRLQVQRAELEAERVQQEALYAWRPAEQAGESVFPETAARSNASLYAQVLGVTLPPGAEARVVSAALSSVSEKGRQS